MPLRLERIEQQHVEPAVGIGPPHQVQARGGDQAGLLGRGDALGGAAEALVAAVAHLGEHQRAALLGHEVDFAVPAAPVARQHAQARLAQQFRAQFLGSRAGPVHGSLNGPPPRKVDPAVGPRIRNALRRRHADRQSRRFEPPLHRGPARGRHRRLRGHAHLAHAARAPRHRRAHGRAARAQRARGGREAAARPARRRQRGAGQRRRHARRSPIRARCWWPRRTAKACAWCRCPARTPRSPPTRPSGFVADRFLFAGFLSARKKNSFEDLDVPWPVILYEAPHRVLATVQRAARAASGPSASS